MNIFPSIPGYQDYEYLLLLSPHEELTNRISEIKKDFAATYRLTETIVSKPHITLLKFFTWSLMEERFLQRFQNIAAGTVPFKIELKDYGSFPSHTIYINVTTKVPIQNLVKDLRSVQRFIKTHPDHDPYFITEPHVTIARKLKPWQYEQGWLAYSHQHFTSRFIAEDMLLLKRPAGEKRYSLVQRFAFTNLAVKAQQGELFL